MRPLAKLPSIKMAKPSQNAKSGRIRVGIGGWSYAPWRGTFYPKGLKQAEELRYAASHLTSIELNATHYRLQNAKTYRVWAEAVPDDFVFSVKGHRLVTQQKLLAETGGFIKRFFDSGLAELGPKLGPVLWQFAPFKRFDREDFARFLDHLPRDLDGRALHHAVEVRHASFRTPEFVKLLRDAGMGIVFTDAETWPSIADTTGDIVYARLQRGDDKLPAAYPPKELHAWAERARVWAEGGAPKDLPLVDSTPDAAVGPRDVFIYFIHEGKLRAPAAAMALIERLS
jgi:uncharacterized protein YecE (DUF72 family)